MKSYKKLHHSYNKTSLDTRDHEQLLSEYIVNKETISHLLEENEEHVNSVVSLRSDIGDIEKKIHAIEYRMYELNMNLHEIEDELTTISRIGKLPVIGRLLKVFLPEDKFHRNLEATLEEHKKNDLCLFECMTDKKKIEENIQVINQDIKQNKEMIIDLKDKDKDYESFLNNRNL